MKNLGPAATAAALVCLLAIGTATPVFAAGHDKKPSGEIANVQHLTATVEKINHATRVVTLKGPEGNVRTIKVGEGVKHLEQVKVGDQVVVRVTEAFALSVVKP